MNGGIASKTILNWRFYIGFTILILCILAAVALEVTSKPLKIAYMATKRFSEDINYSNNLRRFSNWTFKN